MLIMRYLYVIYTLSSLILVVVEREPRQELIKKSIELDNSFVTVDSSDRPGCDLSSVEPVSTFAYKSNSNINSSFVYSP